MQFSVEVTATNGGTIPLCKAIVERAGTSDAITATGRQWGKRDYFSGGDYEFSRQKTLYNANDNLRYRVGQELAIQTGRGKPGVWYRQRYLGNYDYEHEKDWRSQYENYKQKNAYQSTYENWLRFRLFRPARIRITSLEKLDVREMTDAQARRTGFELAVDYLAWWATQYDKAYHGWTDCDWEHEKKRPELWSEGFSYRPDELYTMVFIGFEFIGAE